jgi:hypothetical protein
LTSGKKVKSSQSFDLYLLEIGVIRQRDMTYAEPPSPSKEHGMAIKFTLGLPFHKHSMLCCNSKYQIQYSCPSFPEAHSWIRIEGSILSQEDCLSNNREGGVHSVEVVFDEPVSNMLWGSAQ